MKDRTLESPNGPITFRPAKPEDREFFFRVYAGSREEELRPVPWTDEEKEAFLRSQFDAQSEHYATHWASAEFLLILVNGNPAGRLYLDRSEDEFRIVDIALLPEFRQRGTGTLILQAIISESESAKKPITIHVEQNNPAMNLYLRLGFEKIDEHGIYHLMERRPADRSH